MTEKMIAESRTEKEGWLEDPKSFILAVNGRCEILQHWARLEDFIRYDSDAMERVKSALAKEVRAAVAGMNDRELSRLLTSLEDFISTGESGVVSNPTLVRDQVSSILKERQVFSSTGPDDGDTLG